MLSFVRWAAAPAIAVMFLSSAPAAELQGGAQATVVMKNGERHSGTNPRHRPDKGEFALRKSLAEEFRVPGNTVAYVDFGGAPDVNPRITGSQWAVVLKNGNVVRGTLIEMGHTNPSDTSSEYLISFQDENGQEQRWTAAQVGRVYFAGGGSVGTTGSGAQTSNTPPAEGEIVVSSQQQWTPVGITVRRGETITFQSSGQLQLSADSNDIGTVAGAKSGRRPAASAPLPDLPAGALIARIGNSAPFPIGDQTSLPMPASGQLFLGINDDSLGDNQGEYRVTVRRGAQRRR